MFCQNCGKEIDNNAKFCDGCGTKVQTEQISSNKNLIIIIICSLLIAMLTSVLTFALTHNQQKKTTITINSNEELFSNNVNSQNKSNVLDNIFIGSKVLVEVKINNSFLKPNKAIMNATKYRLEKNLKNNNFFDAEVKQISKDKFLIFMPNEFDATEIKKVLTLSPAIEFKKLVLGETYKNPKYVNSDLTISDFKKITYEKLKNDSYVVNIEFNKIGTEKFAKLSKELIGKQLAIFINGDLVSAPTVLEAITGGKTQISGDFSYKEAKEMADMLNASIFPTSIKIVDIK